MSLTPAPEPNSRPAIGMPGRLSGRLQPPSGGLWFQSAARLPEQPAKQPTQPGQQPGGQPEQQNGKQSAQPEDQPGQQNGKRPAASFAGSACLPPLPEGILTVLLFLLLREWLQPILELTDVAVLAEQVPFYAAVGCFLLLDWLRVPQGLGWPLKLAAIWGAVFWLFSGEEQSGSSWIAVYWRLCGEDWRAVLAGNPDLVSVENRTFLFLLGWGMLAAVIHAIILHYRRALWFVSATLLFLLLLPVWTGIDLGYAPVRAFVLGLMLLSLLQLPGADGYRTLPNRPHTRRIFGRLLFAAVLTGLCLAAGWLGARRQPDVPVVPAWAQQPQQWAEAASRWLALWPDSGGTESGGFAAAAANRAAEVDGGMPALTGYSRDDSRLGGPLQPDDSIVFVAKTTRPTYWRGETKDYYDGKGWRQTSEAIAATGGGIPPGRAALPAASSAGTASHAEVITQEILPSRASGEQLFAGGPILRIDALIGEHGNILDPAAAVRTEPADGKSLVQAGTDRLAYYKLEVQAPPTRDEVLQLLTNEAPAPALAPYLQVPAELPQRVRSFAADITAGASDDLARAEAIQSYLQMHYTYSLTVPEPDGKSDFVDQFLFAQKAGYCDYFSTAMTVMLRTIGIPARWVKGYAPGDIASGEQSFDFPSGTDHASHDTLADEGRIGVPPADTSAAAGSGLTGAGGQPAVYTVTVRNLHAHSWVEAYLPGAGWVTFDPTPGFAPGGSERKAGLQLADAQAQSAAQLAAAPSAGLAQSAAMAKGRAALQQLGGMLHPAGQWLRAKLQPNSRMWAVGAILLLLLPAAGWLFRRLGVTPYRPQRTASGDKGREQLLQLFDRLWRRLFRRFGPPQPQQTLREYMAKLMIHDPAQQSALAEFAHMYEQVRYGSSAAGTLPPKQAVCTLWQRAARANRK